MGERRKAEHMGHLSKESIFYKLPVRSLVTTGEFMTSWGRMNQSLRETLIPVSQPR